MPVKIGDKYYCFARCGCNTNKDIIIEALLESAKKFSDPHVKRITRKSMLTWLQSVKKLKRHWKKYDKRIYN